MKYNFGTDIEIKFYLYSFTIVKNMPSVEGMGFEPIIRIHTLIQFINNQENKVY